jgi:hypothetical protein
MQLVVYLTISLKIKDALQLPIYLYFEMLHVYYEEKLNITGDLSVLSRT